jgi:hypothetical protein
VESSLPSPSVQTYALSFGPPVPSPPQSTQVSAYNGTSTNTSAAGITSPSNPPDPLSCQTSNQTDYIAPSGTSYLIECGIAHFGSDLTFVEVANFEDCILSCDGTQGCVAVSLSGATCRLKSSLGPAVSSPGAWGARAEGVVTQPPPPVNCPDDDGTQQTSPNNQTFVVECGVDYVTGPSQQIGRYDMPGTATPRGGMSGETWFQQCIDMCGNTTACVHASLSGSKFKDSRVSLSPLLMIGFYE